MFFLNGGEREMVPISARIWAAWRAFSPTFAVFPLRPNLSEAGLYSPAPRVHCGYRHSYRSSGCRVCHGRWASGVVPGWWAAVLSQP